MVVVVDDDETWPVVPGEHVDRLAGRGVWADRRVRRRQLVCHVQFATEWVHRTKVALAGVALMLLLRLAGRAGHRIGFCEFTR